VDLQAASRPKLFKSWDGWGTAILAVGPPGILPADRNVKTTRQDA